VKENPLAEPPEAPPKRAGAGALGDGTGTGSGVGGTASECGVRPAGVPRALTSATSASPVAASSATGTNESGVLMSRSRRVFAPVAWLATGVALAGVVGSLSVGIGMVVAGAVSLIVGAGAGAGAVAVVSLTVGVVSLTVGAVSLVGAVVSLVGAVVSLVEVVVSLPVAVVSLAMAVESLVAAASLSATGPLASAGSLEVSPGEALGSAPLVVPRPSPLVLSETMTDSSARATPASAQTMTVAARAMPKYRPVIPMDTVPHRNSRWMIPSPGVRCGPSDA
jgi:hypothetical protein